MKFSDVLRFFYGLSMGTSTQYLRPTKRPIFNQELIKIDDSFYILKGGTENCGILIDGQKNVLLIDTGDKIAAQVLKDKIFQIDSDLKVKSIVSTHYHRHATEGRQIFESVETSWIGKYAPEKFSTDIRAYLNMSSMVDKSFEFKWGDEQVHITSCQNGHTHFDLVVELKKRRYLFLGGLFYNRLHPELSELDPIDINNWTQYLSQYAHFVRQNDLHVVPGEGDLTDSSERLLEFAQYLKDLNNQNVEFSRCRELYDWPEIVGISSLAQNFDYLRYKLLTHTTLNAHRD